MIRMVIGSLATTWITTFYSFNYRSTSLYTLDICQDKKMLIVELFKHVVAFLFM